MPNSTMQYFNDSSELSYPTYMRVVGVRNCLENIVNTVFIYLTDKKSKETWIKKTTLSKKINLTENYFPEHIFTKINNLRILGNTVHPDTEEHNSLTHEEINLALEDVSKICEWVISTYLKKYGFHEESWIPTMISTLPPIYRISILEDLFNYYKKNISNEDILAYINYVQHTEAVFGNALALGEISFELYQELTSQPLPKQKEFSQILLIVDKLAMAYLKNGNYTQSIEFIELQFNEQRINKIFKAQMIDKLKMLEQERSNLPISQNLEQTKEYFKQILTVVKEEEYSLFITLFTSIVAQDELINKAITNE